MIFGRKDVYLLKKTLAFILSVLLLAALFAPSTFAEGAPTITIAAISAAPGENVTVEVRLSNCESFSCYEVIISYDASLLTPTKAKRVIGAGGLFMPNLNYGDGGKVYCSYINASSCTESGIMFTLSFDVAEDFSGIKTVPLEFVKCELMYFNGSKDVKYDTVYSVGQIVISSGGNHIVVDDGESDSSQTEIYPGYISSDDASGYINPITGESASGEGYYYYNEDEKIAVPTSDAEKMVETDDNWKVAEGSSSSEVSSSSEGEAVITQPTGSTRWKYVLYICGVLLILVGAFVAYKLIRKKPETATTATEKNNQEGNLKNEEDR